METLILSRRMRLFSYMGITTNNFRAKVIVRRFGLWTKTFRNLSIPTNIYNTAYYNYKRYEN